MLLSLFCINPTFAATSHTIYDAKGNLMASCGEKGCEYFIYQGVSRVGVVKNNHFTHQANGIDGKAGEIVRDQTGIKSSELWIADFHGSVIAKLTKAKSETILFDAFGSVLNESTNLEDCEDYHYTDKPRVGCTSLHNFNARFYDPKIGRFITTDPIEQHNLNWFVYVNNNPLSFTDPTGRFVSEGAGAVIAAQAMAAETTVSASVSASFAPVAFVPMAVGFLTYFLYTIQTGDRKGSDDDFSDQIQARSRTESLVSPLLMPSISTDIATDTETEPQVELYTWDDNWDTMPFILRNGFYGYGLYDDEWPFATDPHESDYGWYFWHTLEDVDDRIEENGDDPDRVPRYRATISEKNFLLNVKPYAVHQKSLPVKYVLHGEALKVFDVFTCERSCITSPGR